MEVLVARRPILTRRRSVYGYALRFRPGLETCLDGAFRGRATDRDPRHSVLTTVAAGAKAFVALSPATLLAGRAPYLPGTSLVVELSADVEPTDDLVRTCRELKSTGCRLAMDDGILGSPQHPLLPLVDFIRSDFPSLPDDRRRALPYVGGPRTVAFIADNVESEEDFVAATEAGYSYAEGYFFTRRVLTSGGATSGLSSGHIGVLQEARRPEINFNRLEGLIKREPTLALKVLQYVNSASFGLRNKAVTVKHALLIMGEERVRRLISLMVLGDVPTDRSPELIRMAAIRGSFCEGIASATRREERADELFLLGLFSMLDAVVGAPLEELLRAVPLAPDVADALLGRASPYQPIHELMIAVERGDWDEVDRSALALDLPSSTIAQAWLHAIEWAQSVLR